MNTLVTDFLSNNPRCSGKQLLEFLETNNLTIVDKNKINQDSPVRGMFKDIRDKNSVHIIFPDKTEETDTTRVREKEKGFKIRMEKESSKQDEIRKKK